MQTDGRAVYGHVITKFSAMGRFTYPWSSCKLLHRPISNLKVISKLTEKVVAVRLQKYLEANQLNEPLQSAYKPLHNCETGLMRVHNDILVAIDKRHCVMLLLLDLSAAFDTVDHDILLTRLHSK